MRYFVDLQISACLSELWEPLQVRAWHISTSNLDASSLANAPPRRMADPLRVLVRAVGAVAGACVAHQHQQLGRLLLGQQPLPVEWLIPSACLSELW
eukprot:CAMPEP_0173282788 /NCGR_PEP_ID=MMETSP1143-20121109/7020_1 /TAXON_ID=483371 /ORGANISM="non described non described, Strain CCMP2298" /LENGTH=96 /DNA_ID=CAMNT_0014220409 /DNA_START=557 /DNA_END=845 /DNA_ORIENTATION=-